MKKIYLLLLLFTGIVNAQIVNIPDANFKSRLIALGVDTNSDGEIQVSEAAVPIFTLMLAGSNITSLEGIQAFTVVELDCSNNQITTLDLGSMDVDAVNCSNNGMTSLNVSGTSIGALNCSNNLLTEVNFNANPLQTYPEYSIDIHNNLITQLVLPSYMIQFDTLNISNNLMTTFAVSTQQIYSFSCSGNNSITAIDLSGVQMLLNCSIQSNANLQYVNLKNGWRDYCNEPDPDDCNFLNSPPQITGNPQLQYICVDESDLDHIQAALAGQDINYSTYCNFVPGGGYNTITGMAHFDSDNNGCTNEDLLAPRVKIKLTTGSTIFTTFLNEQGNYTFYTGIGNYTFMPTLENAGYFTFIPPFSQHTFDALDNEVQVQDFCMTALGVHPDLEITLVPIDTARPGFDTRYLLIYRNKGNQVQSGNLSLTFDDAVMDLVVATPVADIQTSNSILWNYINLQPFETRVISMTMNLNSPVENPPLNLGDVLNFTSQIDALLDETPEDNTASLVQTVVNALDPNDKTCLEGTNVLPENIGKYLHYNINFENTGTADAINIVVKDTIDTTRFDINSLQLLYASHPVYTKITGNIVEFIFENINLPPSIANPIGGHGNVLFKIKTLPTLTIGDEVSNTANIYFDYNTPIDTNEARTAFNNLSKSDFVKDDSVTMYPNPAKNKVTVKAAGTIKSVQLYDVQGRILQSVADGKSQITLDIANQQHGVYFLRITTDKGSAVEKIIKD